MSKWYAYRDPKADVKKNIRQIEIKKFQSTRKHDAEAPAFKLAISGLAITSVGFLLIMIDVLSPDANPNKIYGSETWVRLWFDTLQYFTNQTNILMFVYFVLFLSAFKTKLFNSNRFTLYVGAYIGIVFLIFWTMLVPTALITEGTNINIFFIITQGWLHFISPVLYFVFMRFAVKYPRRFIHRQIRFGSFIGWGMIYPIIYASYAMAINFIPMPDGVFSDDFINRAVSVLESQGITKEVFLKEHSFISVYGYLTNFNPKCYNIIRATVDDVSNLPTVKIDYLGSYVKFFLVQVAVISFIIVLWFDGLFNNLANSPNRLLLIKNKKLKSKGNYEKNKNKIGE